MTAQYGQRSTFGASDLDLHIAIEDQIIKYPSPRIELLKRLDGSNFKAAVKSHKYEWSSRDNRGISCKPIATVISGATSMTVDTAGVLNKDDIFRKPSGELCRVVSVAGGVNVIFTSISGTPEAMGPTSTITVVGVAAPQGADADNMVTTGYSDMYNYTQIFEDVVELSGTDHASMIRGMENSAQLIARKQQELAEKLNSTLIIGARTKDDAGKITTMGGLKYMIDTYAPNNVVAFGGTGTWSSDASVVGKLDDAIDLIANKAFGTPVMYVGAKFMRRFKLVQDDTTRTTLREKARGVGVVDTYLSHRFGEIDIVMLQDRAGLLDDAVYFVDEKQIGYKAKDGRNWQTSPLAKTGDSFRWQVLGEFTFKMDVPASAAYISGLGL